MIGRSRVIPSEKMGLLHNAALTHLKARNTLLETETACKHALEAARKEGFEAGRYEGVGALLKRVTDMLNEAEKKLFEMEGQVFEIVLQSLALVLGDIQPEKRTRQIVGHAVRNVADKQQVNICICPADEAFMVKAIKKLDPRIKIVLDPHMAPGEIVLETSTGRSQIGLADQMAALLEALNRG